MDPPYRFGKDDPWTECRLPAPSPLLFLSLPVTPKRAATRCSIRWARPDIPARTADLIDTSAAAIGTVSVTQTPHGAILLRIDANNIPKGWHGIHLHNIGDCTDIAAGFKASGSHVNPDNKAHGLMNPDGPDRADMPNIYAHSDQRVTTALLRTGVSLYPSEANATLNDAVPLMDSDGFAVIVHENPDDHISQPIGGAGARIACAAFRE